MLNFAESSKFITSKSIFLTNIAPSDFQNVLLHTFLGCFTAIRALLGVWSLKNSQDLNATTDAVLTVSQVSLKFKIS